MAKARLYASVDSDQLRPGEQVHPGIWDFLTEINNNGTTIILTTHYLEEAEKLCKNISIIDKGEIVKTSSMQSLLRELDTEIFIFDLKNQIDPKPHFCCF